MNQERGRQEQVHVRRTELALAALGAVAVVLLLTGVQGPGRAAVTFPALLLLPGWAVLREIRLDDPVARVALAVMTSVTLATLVGLAMLWTGSWRSVPAAAAVMLSAGALAVLVRRRPGGAREGRS